MPLLDPSADSEVYLNGPVTLSESTPHQQVAVEPVTGETFATQVIQDGRTLDGETGPVSGEDRRARGDLSLSRVDTDGVLLDNMYLKGFDHGAGLVVVREGSDTKVFVAFDALEQPPGADAFGRFIAEFPYEPGVVLDVDSPEIIRHEPVPGAEAITMSMDHVNGVVAFRYFIGSGSFRYRTMTYAEFQAGTYEYLLDFVQEDTSGFQSWTYYDRYIYQFHGDAYGEGNPAPGNARFTLVDTLTRRVVRRVPMTKYPGLEYRAPKSITVWDSPGGPRLLYGFATGTEAYRMNLYAVPSDAGPGAWIWGAAEAGEGIAVTFSPGDPDEVVSWVLTRSDGEQLSSGSGVSGDPLFVLDTRAPSCRGVVYVITVQHPVGTSNIASESVAYIPPEGCPSSSGGSVVSDNAGCATSYVAKIHWRGGGQEFPIRMMDNLTNVLWGRTADDVSSAEVTLSRCGDCSEIESVHPWVHELTIYRNEEIVWQGPIQRIRVRSETVVIEAKDVFAWLDRIVNTFQINYTSTTADGYGRRKGTIVYIARNHISLMLEEAAASVPRDYPWIMDYIVADESGLPVIKVQNTGSSGTATLSEYLGVLLREWVDRGLHFTTVGRSLVLRAWPTVYTDAQARISLRDLVGDVEVIRDGEDAATYAYATTQQRNDFSNGMTYAVGYAGTPYGRLDSLIRIQEDEPDLADLQSVARNYVWGRYPAPMVIQIPQSTQLAPSAPVKMSQLVPGERVDVFDDSHCFDVAQGFALSDVEVTWDGSRERVSVGLIPLSQENT